MKTVFVILSALALMMFVATPVLACPPGGDCGCAKAKAVKADKDPGCGKDCDCADCKAKKKDCPKDCDCADCKAKKKDCPEDCDCPGCKTKKNKTK